MVNVKRRTSDWAEILILLQAAVNEKEGAG